MRRCSIRWAISIAAAILVAPFCSGQVLTTFAGSTWVFRDNGKAATNAALGRSPSVVSDSAGNLFVCDFDNNIVARISKAGTLTVVAGNGIPGYSGDGGPSTSASLYRPSGINLDGDGNLYIIDAGNYRIRKVSPDGTITTFAGVGTGGFSGDGGPATAAQLNFDVSGFLQNIGIAFDYYNNFYFSDTGNHRVRRIDAVTGQIATVAGNGTAGFSGDGGLSYNASLNFPAGLVIDSSGNLGIADYLNRRIRVVTPSSQISTLAGNGVIGSCVNSGPAKSTALGRVSTLGLDAANNVLIVDSECNRIRRVDGALNMTTIAGIGTGGFAGDGGPATSAQLNDPLDITFDPAGNLWISDAANTRIRRVDLSGIISTRAGNGVFKFSGDGGSALTANINNPYGMALDAAGNLYIADTDSSRIRRVTPSGIISTLAGIGIAGFSGDGGPAINAAFGQPVSLVFDAVGNLYVSDFDYSRIRKITPSGIVTTVAGNGSAGYSGDGGPAASASLNLAYGFLTTIGLAVDASGNLYIADAGNDRVRRVDLSGRITTFAGNGIRGYSGDSGAAAAAKLNQPSGLAFDSAGNLYIADQGNNRIRKVTTAGTIGTVAGNGFANYSGDGGPAIAASLYNPLSVAVDATGGLLIADSYNDVVRRVDGAGIIRTIAGGGTGGDGSQATSAQLIYPTTVLPGPGGSILIAEPVNDRIRVVLSTPPTFTVSPLTLKFSAIAGGPVSEPRAVTISSPVAGLRWSATLSTTSGGNWMQTSFPSGFTPGQIGVTVNPGGLAPGTYAGTITVQAPQSSTGSQTVDVQLNVATAQPALLRVDPMSVRFETTVGAGNPPLQTLRIGNAGGGTLNWSAQAITASGTASGVVFGVTPSSGSATPGSPSVVQVTATVGSSPAGVYSGIVRITSSGGGPVDIPVSLLLTRNASTMLLSQTGLLFTGVQGGTMAPSQTIGIVNVGQGTMNWTAEASTLSGNNWLSVTPASGSSVANSLQIPLVEIQVNTTGLTAGHYSGIVRVRAPGADNSPQVTTIDLNVLPSGSNPGPHVRPTGLIFATQAGTSSPGSKTVRIATPAPGRVSATGGVVTLDQGTWMNAQPRSLDFSPEDPRTITVQPALGLLTPGIYRGALTLVFGDGSIPQAVNILFIVTAGGPRPAASGDGPVADTVCQPQSLLAVFQTGGSSLNSGVGWGTPIEAQVLDNCGTSVPNATVVASFDNQDPPLTLNSLRNGTYTATWKPSNAAAQTTIHLRASLPPLTPADVSASGSVNANIQTPRMYNGGVVNAASFAPGAALAPGSIVSIFGLKLGVAGAAANVPLPVALGGASISIGDKDVPMFVSSDGQINAQIPFDLPVNSRQQVVVKVQPGSGSASFTVPETITVADVRPGIFSTNSNGQGQGVIILNDKVADAGNPARAGDTVVVYCTGLGMTNPPVQSGQVSPGTPAVTVAKVTATVGGVLAPVDFAGLTPGLVGLYQVNVRIPTGVATGDSVALVLTQNGVQSNSVTFAVR